MTSKKVQIQRWERTSLAGFVNSQTFLTDHGIEFLTQSGSVSIIPYTEIKAVHFVREFDESSSLERTSFHARPKMGGLWVRLRFRDNELLEAVIPNDLLQIGQFGVAVVPPDANGNTQRLFVPRSALLELEVLSVIGSPLRAPKKRPAGKEQIGLFDDKAAG